MMRDTAMFGGKNYWMADLVLVSLTITLLVLIARKAIPNFFKKTCEVVRP